jgi:hypothetical protein
MGLFECQHRNEFFCESQVEGLSAAIAICVDPLAHNPMNEFHDNVLAGKYDPEKYAQSEKK